MWHLRQPVRQERFYALLYRNLMALYKVSHGWMARQLQPAERHSTSFGAGSGAVCGGTDWHVACVNSTVHCVIAVLRRLVLETTRSSALGVSNNEVT
jgi:hypothetical protein